jgi:hypothetical protein
MGDDGMRVLRAKVYTLLERGVWDNATTMSNE